MKRIDWYKSSVKERMLTVDERVHWLGIIIEKLEKRCKSKYVRREAHEELDYCKNEFKYVVTLQRRKEEKLRIKREYEEIKQNIEKEIEFSKSNILSEVKYKGLCHVMTKKVNKAKENDPESLFADAEFIRDITGCKIPLERKK